MFGNSLGSFYTKIEDKWYSAIDWLDRKGIPFYVFTDFLEKRGIPSLPFSIAVLFLLVLLLSTVSFGTAVNATLSFNISDAHGDPLQGVTVTITDAAGKQVEKKAVSDGGKILLQGAPVGAVYEISAAKPGYVQDDTTAKIDSASVNVYLTLRADLQLAEGMLSLVDERSGTAVRNPVCIVKYEGLDIDGSVDSKQVIHFSGIPAGEEVIVQCTANGYEDLSIPIAFREGETMQQVMTPLTAALTGDSFVLVSLYEWTDGEAKPLSGVRLIIKNAETGNTISDVNLGEDAEYAETLKKGTVITITAEKEGFITAVWPETTLREEETPIEIVMRKGGEKLVVRVNAEDTGPLSGAIVQLYDAAAELIKEETTDFSGFVELVGMDPNATYYITAYKDLYVAQRKKIIPGELEELVFTLEYASPQNSSTLSIKVLDSAGFYANGASLYFYERSGEEVLPLGIPVKYADLRGEAIAQVEKEKLVVVVAKKDLEEGEGEAEITQSSHEMEIQMEKPVNFVELKLVDEFGNPVPGTANISTQSGEELYSGEISDAIWFDSQGNEKVVLAVEQEGEKIYEEEVEVDSKTEIEIEIPLGEEARIPAIEFLGVFNAMDEEVEGITRGEYYWLKFSASLPQSEKSGVHVRVGNDSQKFADEQRVGIYGFDSAPGDFFFGRSYQPPSGQAIDYKNRGKAGEKNKWVEIYFDNPADTEIIRVKVKTEETFSREEFEVHFRAFAKFRGKFYNSPQSTGEMQLYSETYSESVRVFTTRTLCSEGLCAGYLFRDAEGMEFRENEFKPILERPYALEITLSAKEGEKVNLTASTRANAAAMAFWGISLDEFAVVPEQGYELASADIADVQVERGEEVKAVVYFMPKETGQGYLEISVQGTENEIRKKFYFDVAEERNISIEMPGKGKLTLGENLFLRLTDAETSEFLTNAKLRLENIDTEKIEVSTVGTNTRNNGLNGEYSLETSHLEPGFYKIVASLYGYVEAEKPVIILTDEVLEIESPVEISMERCALEGKCETSGEATAKITNNLGLPVEVKGFRFEHIRMPNEFTLSADVSDILEGESAVYITAVFSGMYDKHLHGESDLVIEGSVGNVSVEATARVKVSYNKELPSDCLTIDKDSLQVLMLGNEGSTETVSFEVEYSRREECYRDSALEFSVYSEALRSDEDITVEETTFSLSPGEKRDVRLSITNNIKRFYSASLKREFEIFIESADITKSIPLTVLLKDPVFFLETNDNITLWMSKDEESGEISGIAPLYMRNTGELPIESLSFSIAESPASINITVLQDGGNLTYLTQPALQAYSARIPMGDGMALYGAPLQPGEQASPPKTIYASTTSTGIDKGPHRAIIEIRGVVKGEEHFLRNVAVWIHVSTPKCLKLYMTDTDFRSAESEQGTISKTATIENNCGETVREITLDPKKFGENTLNLNPLRKAFLSPGEKTEWKVIMEKREDYSAETELRAKGFLVSTQRYIYSDPIPITIAIGTEAETSAGPSLEAFTMPVCETDEEKEIHYPDIASYEDKDCAQGYCDAVQLSEFLLKKAEEKIQAVKRRLQDGSYDVSNFDNCQDSAGLCSFTSLDVTPTVLTVYMNNDNLSAEVAEHVKDTGSFPELKGFVVDYFDGTISDLVSREGFFAPFHLYMPTNVTGCGKYVFSVKGAVQNIQGKLEEDKILILIEFTEERKITPECTNEVQNVMNFLPVDKGLTHRNNKSAWPATVEATSELEELGKKIADELFDDEKRSTTGSVSLNKLRLKYGDEEQGGILVIKLMRVSSTEARPKTVEALITPMHRDSADDVKETLEESIVEAFGKLAQSSQDLDMCIDAQGESFTLLGLESRGEISISGEERIELYYEEEGCADLNVFSSVMEKVSLKTNWKEMREAGENAGLSDVYIKVAGERVKEYSNEERVLGDSFRLERNPAGNNYYMEFQVCAKGDIDAIDEAFGKEVKVRAKSASFAGREMKDWHSVSIELCWIHPYSLLDKLEGVHVDPGETKTFYATLNWEGDPDKITTAALDKARAAMETLEEGDIPAGEAQEGSTLLPASSGPGILAGMAACTITDFGIGVFMYTPLGSLVNSVFDCIVPGLWNYLKTTTWGTPIVKALTTAWQTVKKIPVIGHIISGVQTALGWVARGISKAVSGIYGVMLGEPGASAEEATENLLASGVTGVQINSVRRYLTSEMAGTKLLDLVSIRPGHEGQLTTAGRAIAKETADRVAADYVDVIFTGASSSADDIIKGVRTELAKALQSEMETELRRVGNTVHSNHAAAKLFGGDELGRGYRTASVSSIIDDASKGPWSKAYEKLWSSKFAARGTTKKSMMDWVQHADVKGAEIANRILQAKASVLDDLAGPALVEGVTFPDFGIDDIHATGARDKVVDAVTNSISGKLKSKGINLTSTMQTNLRESVETAVGAVYAETPHIPGNRPLVPNPEAGVIRGNNAKVAAQMALDDFVSKYGDNLLRASPEALKAMAQKLGITVDELLELGAKKTFWQKWFTAKGWAERGRRLVNWRNLKEFGKAAGLGMLANWVGGFVAEAVNAEAPEEAEAGIAAPTIEGEPEFLEGYIVSSPEYVYKHRTYRVDVTGGRDGKPRYSLNMVDTPEEREEMREAIAENPDIVLTDSCSESPTRDMGGVFIARLVPDFEKEGDYARAYYLYGDAFSSTATYYQLDDSLLMAVLMVSPEKIRDCGIPNDWFKQADEIQKQSIDCAGKKLWENSASNLRSQPGDYHENLEGVLEGMVGSSAFESTEDWTNYIDMVYGNDERWNENYQPD